MHRIAIVVFALLGAAAGTAHADRRWVSYDEPPAQRSTEHRHRSGYVWIEGHWALYDDGWRWIDGHYERDSAKRVYVVGNWEPNDGAYRWRSGRWVDRKQPKRYRRDRDRDHDRQDRDDRRDDRRERRRGRRGRGR